MDKMPTTQDFINDKPTAGVTSNYSIRIISDMYDPDLIRHWKRIEEVTECFPQMYYEWCEPWWRLQSGNRKLHIVSVEDENREIVGIAPLCIEKQYGLRILRSFPVHFGDFYYFLIQDDGHYGEIVDAIADYVKTYAAWELVHLFHVNSKSMLWKTLLNKQFNSKKLTNICVANFADLSFNEFLKTLSHNRRQKYSRSFRRLEESGNVTLEYIENASGYMAYLEEMKRLYNDRWADDHTLPPDDVYYQCRNEAVSAIFEKNKMILFILKSNDKVICFDLGFMHNQTFYDWKGSHDPNYDWVSPGIVNIAKIIEELISRGYKEFNFMAGDYEFKSSWSTEGAGSANYELFACGHSILAGLYLKYRMEWRDELREFYHSILKINWVRATTRWMQTQRRRMQS
jgi:CelD/BcsL family acetyltransferase involved in cellulose biosynthesis